MDSTKNRQLPSDFERSLRSLWAIDSESRGYNILAGLKIRECAGTFMPDHWNKLADQLGTPSIEPRAKSTTVDSINKDASPSSHSMKDEPSARSDDRTDPAVTEEPAKSTKPIKKSSWDSVVEFFGLGHRSSSASSPEAEAISEPSTVPTPQKTTEAASSSHKAIRDKSMKKARPSMWGDVPSETVPTIEKADSLSSPRVAEPLHDDLIKGVEPDSLNAPERSGPRRRPRRGGERQRMHLRDEEADSGSSFPDASLEPDLFGSSELMGGVDQDLIEVPGKSSSEDRDDAPRRRRRRRRGEARRHSEDQGMIASREPADSDDSDEFVEDEKRDDDRLQRAIRVKVPTWEEAMSSLIEANIANHQKSQTHSRRRPPSGRS